MAEPESFFPRIPQPVEPVKPVNPPFRTGELLTILANSLQGTG